MGSEKQISALVEREHRVPGRGGNQENNMQTIVLAQLESSSEAVLVQQPTETVNPLNHLTTTELMKRHFGDGLLEV
jgi:hypothetical protein